MGRSVRTERREVRLTPEESTELTAKAERHGISVSEYMRYAALQRNEEGGIGNITARRVTAPTVVDRSEQIAQRAVELRREHNWSMLRARNVAADEIDGEDTE